MLGGAWMALVGAAPPGSIDADISGLRSNRGQVLVCLTMRADHFPDCHDDPQARRMAVPAAQAGALRFSGLPSGGYAIALIHDENGNNKLDTVLGIPREGFGFSCNPVIRFGAPKFAAARFAVTSGTVDETVRVKYML
ncbi:DUF2141 domain-containing protein [Sphingomonas sp.]|uniref:DUF2141 domain-containing protein n=1 Tax=Sphingomonas sp. TaxID=28214 RepID=UPI0025D14C69|nr:DUF2141 domain-containing protein [Sphingomonas sp.]